MARKSVKPPSTIPKLPLIQGQAWLKRLVGQINTRILLLYAITMLLVMVASAPIFRFFLFAEVNERVRADLREELEAFQKEYAALDATTPEADQALMELIDEFFASKLPEDDNFHIIILDGELYQSNPTSLPSAIQPGSEVMQRWLTLKEPTRDVIPVSDPKVGDVIYKTSVLELNDSFRGKFVAAHLAAGERAETLATANVLVKVATVSAGFAFLIAWLYSRLLLQPIQQLAKIAQGISESNLSQRLEVHGSGELATVARTFNTMMDRLQSAMDNQRNFINDAGHELRNPITIIQGHLELMNDDPKEQRETLNLVMDELDRMGRFVHDLVLLTKAERPDFLLLETIDLISFTKVLFSKVTALADRNWQLSYADHGTFVADRQRITGALINLAQNATQHTQPTDTIELGSKMAEGQVRFWVRDTGEGISPADQKRIFERFARGTNSYRRSEGVGLGLAIVKAIADSHGGSVELSSQLGVGSAFSLIVPLEQPEG